MTRCVRLPWVLVGGMLAGLVAGGCAPPPPSEDAILYYLRNACVQGPVRRAWPAGQAYLDAIMKQTATLRNESSPLQALTSPESLWLEGDPRWRDRVALEAEAKRLEKLLLPVGDAKAARDKAVADLQQAVAEVPTGLSLDDAGRKDAFVGKVWAAHGMADPPIATQVADLEANAQQRVELYRAVLSALDDLDATQPGLRFQDNARQAAVQQQYDAIKRRLISGREKSWAHAEETMIVAAKELQTINKRERRWDYELLNNEMKYLRDGLEAEAKQLAALADRTAAKVKALEAQVAGASGSEKAKLELQLKGERQCATELGTRAQELRARFDEVKKRVVEAAKHD